MPYHRMGAGIWHYLPNPTLPNEEHLNALLERLPCASLIADIGSGGRLISPDIITFDRFVTNNTKVIGDIHHLPFRSGSLDCIICTGTLEHVENPWLVVNEFFRVLKSGGMVYIATPFMQGYHPDPADYWRFTEEGLRTLCKSFKRLDSGCLMGSGSGLSWAITDFFRAFSDGKFLSELFGIAARFMFVWVKYFDLVLKRKRNNALFASGYYFIGGK